MRGMRGRIDDMRPSIDGMESRIDEMGARIADLARDESVNLFPGHFRRPAQWDG